MKGHSILSWIQQYTLQHMRYKYMNKVFSSFSEATQDSYVFSLVAAML